MKKVKFLLAFVVVIIIVGGTLAFKARKLPFANVYCSTFTSALHCQRVPYTTDSFVWPSDEPCDGNLYYTRADCPSETAFTTQYDGFNVEQPVSAVIE